MDNSSLTGESEPVQLQANLMERNIMESRNMAFFSTNVVEGTARGVVLRTGDRTVMGNIAHLVTSISAGQTPIKKVRLYRDRTVMSNIAHLVTSISAGQTPIKKVRLYRDQYHRQLTRLFWAQTRSGHLYWYLLVFFCFNMVDVLFSQIFGFLIFTCDFFHYQEINAFIKVITAIAIFLGLLFGIISFAMGNSWIRSILFLIGIIVANVPEGLLLTVTVTLTLAAQRMARKNCLVRNLEAVETLGSTSVICSDKTGTLTQNRMTVAHMWFDTVITAVDTAESSYGAGFPREQAGWRELGRVAALCSRAEFYEEDQCLPPVKRRVRGDASEAGLLKCYEAIMADSAEIRREHPKLAEIPFNSTNKFQVSVHAVGHTGRHLVVMKGAPEIILSRCSHLLVGRGAVPLDESHTQLCQAACQQLADLGERVLAFCDLELGVDTLPPGHIFTTEPEPNFPLQNLR